jgi:hypothetical protein
LQLALSGVKEMSIIATPPVDRLAVRTFVTPFDPVTLREALLREHYRGGQSFFVCPRISDLADAEEFMKTAVPEVKYMVANGQLAPTRLEDIMSSFYDGKFDVLISTPIVESGLDIPTANTLIVYRAHVFGLAQLYQLRGRVGRGKTRAYALFTVPATRTLTAPDASGTIALTTLAGCPAELVIACSDETTNLTTGTAKVTFRMPYAMTLSSVRASVNTAPTGSTLIVDINEGGNSILSTKLSIDASEKTSTTAASAKPPITNQRLRDTAASPYVGEHSEGEGMRHAAKRLGGAGFGLRYGRRKRGPRALSVAGAAGWRGLADAGLANSAAAPGRRSPGV